MGKTCKHLRENHYGEDFYKKKKYVNFFPMKENIMYKITQTIILQILHQKKNYIKFFSKFV